MSAHRLTLIEELRDPEYRQYYAEQHLNAVLATQIRAVREQRGLTQARLAEKIDKHQAAISRIENVNYARWNITTLRQIAAALGCWLSVRLQSWGRLVDDVEAYSIDGLRQERFEDDPVFWGSVATGPVPESVRWVQQRLFPWLTSQESDPMIVDWLQGLGLPPVGDLDPPHVWITRAIEVEGPDSRYRVLLIGWLLRHLPIARETAAEVGDPEAYLTGLFSLVATFSEPRLFSSPIQSVCDFLAQAPASFSESTKASLLTAVIRNQGSLKLKETWMTTILTGEHPFLPANELDAFEGLKWLPPRPNLRALAEGLKALEQAKLARQAPVDLVAAMNDIQSTFRDFTQLDHFLARELADCGWSENLFRVWREVFAPTYDDQIRLASEAYTFSSDPGVLPSEFSRLLNEERLRRGDDEELLDALDRLRPVRPGCGVLPPPREVPELHFWE